MHPRLEVCLSDRSGVRGHSVERLDDVQTHENFIAHQQHQAIRAVLFASGTGRAGLRQQPCGPLTSRDRYGALGASRTYP